MRHVGVTLIATLLVSGCEDPPESYHYAFRFQTDSADEMLDLPREVPLFLGGTEIGVLRGPDQLSVELPASTWVSEARITITPDATTCGDEERPLGVSFTRADEERQRRIQADSDFPDQTPVQVSLRPPPPPRRVPLVLDNHENASPLRAQVGQQTLPELGPGQHRRDTVTLGACPEAAIVRIGGEEVFRLDATDDQHMLLVDGTGTHCYMWETIAYGAGVELEPERYPAARAQAVKRAALVFDDAPSSTVVRVARGEPGAARTTRIGRIPCASSERAAPSQ